MDTTATHSRRLLSFSSRSLVCLAKQPALWFLSRSKSCCQELTCFNGAGYTANTRATGAYRWPGVKVALWLSFIKHQFSLWILERYFHNLNISAIKGKCHIKTVLTSWRIHFCFNIWQVLKKRLKSRDQIRLDIEHITLSESMSFFVRLPVLITISQSLIGHLQMTYFVQLTVLNIKTLHLLPDITKKSSILSCLRSWNQIRFDFFIWQINVF